MGGFNAASAEELRRVEGGRILQENPIRGLLAVVGVVSGVAAGVGAAVTAVKTVVRAVT